MITREDDTITETCILEAIDCAKAYLNRYNLSALFGVESPATAPTVTSPQLKRCVKDIAVFNLATLANANYNMDVLNTRKEDALRWLKSVQKGEAMPAGWPERDTTEDSFEEGNQVSAYYNEKQTNRI